AGIGAATHEWVFALDADERVGPELSAELAATVAAPAREAYAVRRRNVFLGETVRHAGWGRDWVVRLFRKNRRFVERKVHEALEPVPDVGRLAALLDHVLHRVGRGRARGPRAAAPSHRPDRPAPGPVRPDVLPAARDPGRMARRHAVRACRCECARQVRAALGAVAVTNLLLAQDFPPMGGGIARLHGEMAKRYPAGQLVVSTPQDPDAADFDAQLDGIVDRLPVGRRRTKSLPGLLLWSRRAATLARRHKVRFVHCGNVKPAGYPARWVLERCRVPYGIYFHGGDLLSEQHKIRHSRLKRRSTRAILGGAAVLMVNSAWTRDLALSVLGELGLDGHGQRLRVVHLGTDPGRFMPGVDPTE